MTKIEYMDQLKAELKKKDIADAEDILAEYEQHFAFKLADGYCEEEIAAKLGQPQAIAAQFDNIVTGKASNGANFIVKIGLFFAAIFEVMFYALFLAWDIVLAASSISLAALGVCLISHVNVAGLIPYMPYLGALILGISILGLAVLFAIAGLYCFEFLRQMIRSSVRWHRNVCSGNTLPPLPWSPQFEPTKKRRLRTILLWSIAVFGVFFVLALTVLSLQAGVLGFWHHWNWFVN